MNKKQITELLVYNLIKGQPGSVESFLMTIENDPLAVSLFETYFHHILFDEGIGRCTDLGCPNSKVVLSIGDSIMGSNERLSDHISILPEHRRNGTFLEILNYGDKWVAEIGWMDGMAGRCLWDRLKFDCDSAAVAYISWAFFFNIKNIVWKNQNRSNENRRCIVITRKDFLLIIRLQMMYRHCFVIRLIFVQV